MTMNETRHLQEETVNCIVLFEQPEVPLQDNIVYKKTPNFLV